MAVIVFFTHQTSNPNLVVRNALASIRVSLCDLPHRDPVRQEAIPQSPDTVMVIVNGALDKVRDGYYPGIFFPKLAATVDRFYKKFESVFYLKPISDKGVYGWLYRVYPEASFI